MDAITVQAIYSFKGKNNDELCFKKGDVITVTNREEGGWWEGTLGNTTGWFPTNYVKEYNKEAVPAVRAVEEVQAYRGVVLKDLTDSERAHVDELQGLVNNFLTPLEKSDILTADEYYQLTGNFFDVLSCHEQLLSLIESPGNVNGGSDRVGRLFISFAPRMKAVHMTYCAQHPRAVVILDKYKDELCSFMENAGAASPGLLVLTTGLSKPFRRLDKYSAMLQELERHMELSHPDRGDTQRSVAVYKDIASVCAATRRQKELELQVLTGPVRGWQGQQLSMLGEIVHMGSVSVGPERKDRYLVLFPTTLLILSVSQRMSAFIYEGKLPLTGITVNKLEDTETAQNAFEINGPLIEKIVACTPTASEASKWVELLGAQVSPTSQKPTTTSLAIPAPTPPPHMPPLSLSNPSRGYVPTPTPITSPAPLSHHKRSHSFNHQHSYTQHTNGKLINSVGGNFSAPSNKVAWTMTSLRPAPPSRPCVALRPPSDDSQSQRLPSQYISPISARKPVTFEEDALILRVIEAYCSAAKTRNTVNSGILEPDDMVSVKQLATAVKHLQADLASVKLQVQEERVARVSMQTLLQGHLENVRETTC